MSRWTPRSGSGAVSLTLVSKMLESTRASSRAGAIVASAMAAFVLAACTEFEPGTDELTEGVLASTETPETGRDWRCLQPIQTTAPGLVPNPSSAPRLIQSLRTVSMATGDVIPGVQVRACSTRDTACAVPLTANFPTDANGWVDLPLYEGFDGFLEISGDSIVPMTLFYADPLTSGNRVDQTPLGLLERAILTGLSAAAGSVQREDMGLVFLRAFDCQGVPAPGVHFTMDREGWRWYFVDGLPSSEAQETVLDWGLGGFINVAPGTAVVNAELPASPIPIASPRSVIVREGWLSGLRFFPSGAGTL